MASKLSHVDKTGRPRMVDVSAKKVTSRLARAQATVWLGKDVLRGLKAGELATKKGPVFHTAIVAGVMAAKKTAELIPFCHPLALNDCQVKMDLEGDRVVIMAEVKTEGKTGVEMEALTAASVAALTVYDMCKALGHEMVIEEVCLLEKRGGKSDFRRKG
jgi:cyclic pyranopterin phosphate synthase